MTDMSTERLLLEPLSVDHIDAMARLLRHEIVYRHIGGEPPAEERFRLGMMRALLGPPEGHGDERWVNYALRRRDTGELVGRLESTLHGAIAEVAYLLGPTHWGHGYATEGLQWLHGELLRIRPGVSFWATTLPANTHSQGVLRRCGYVPVPPASQPGLHTYDDGDLVFTRPGTA